MDTIDFVTYEQAKVLKELGFDYSTNTYYWLSKTDFYWSDLNNWNKDPDYISAPTLAQAQKWLWEVKDLYVQITRNYIYFSYALMIKYGLYNDAEDSGFISPEEALSKGIDKALELLKENRNELV